MRKSFLSSLSLLFSFYFVSASIGFTQPSKPVFSPEGFKTPPASVGLHTWWHWLDGAITKEGITKDLEAMKAQGIIQATILNVGLFNGKDFGVPRVKFATPEWFEMFHWALIEARRLGITIGAHNCDGWSSTGGPWITPEMSMKQIVWSKTLVKGGGKLDLKLKQPLALQDFYREVAVIAYKTNQLPGAFLQAAPCLTLNDDIDAAGLIDGNPASSVTIKKGDHLSIATAAPVTFDQLAIHPRRSFMWGNADDFVTSFSLSVSQDGKQFSKVLDFSVKGLNKTELISVPLTTARFVWVTVDDLSSIDDFIPVTLSEVELLRGDEKPLFSPTIPYISEKSASIKAGNEDYFYAKASDNPATRIPSTQEVLNLSGKMSADGTLHWDAPEGNWAILRFGYTTTGATNGPATPEGTGLECDKMDQAAVDLHYNHFPKRLLETAGPMAGNTFKFLLIDSWECAYQNWTAAFPAEFEKRRGYSLIPFLPLLSGEIMGTPAESEAVLFDFRKTIAELIEQNYYEHFSELCHKGKLELHAEVMYGNSNYPPLDILKTTRCVDLPMYEFWAKNNTDSFAEYTPEAGPELNMPAAAALGYEKPVMGSEAYTGMAHYSESPNDLKPFGDRAFSSGINQMILHSYVHQPTDRKAGMTLGQFAAHFNRNNLYWEKISPWLTFQARIQYLLQNGAAAPDVLYYLGDQLPQYFTLNGSTTLPFGYQVTSCNFDILKNRVTVVDGKLRLNQKIDFSLLSLPAYPVLDFETLKRIESLVKEGAVIYGPKPLSPLSKADLANHQAEFKELADRVWGNIDGQAVVENRYGKGRIFWGIPMAGVLEKIGLAPDFSTNQQENSTFQFIHKKAGDHDVYFVANQQNVPLTRECLFRVGGKSPEIWDPENGTILKPAIFRLENGVMRIPVTFQPRQSLLFVFTSGKPADFITTVVKDGKRIFPAGAGENMTVPMAGFASKDVTLYNGSAGSYTFTLQSGKEIPGQEFQPEEIEMMGFKGLIQFEPAYPANIPPLEISTLQPLNENSNPDIRYFAGNAKYTISFAVPANYLSSNDPMFLNLGSFDAVAEVVLNGKVLGKVWKSGTSLDVTGLLKSKNELVVTVATVYRNRFIGDFIQYGQVQNLFTSAPITQFLSKDKLLKPSGLIGPIQLIREPRVKLAL
jgi:hypothetical protein